MPRVLAALAFPDVEGAKHPTPDTRVAEHLVGGGVHHLAVVPVLGHLAADALRVLHAHPESLLRIGKVSVIKHPQEENGRILLAHVDNRPRCDARREEE